MNNISYQFDLERELSRNLLPIRPREEFIGQLQNRLTNQKSIYIEERNYGLAIIALSLGLFAGVLSLWFFRRII